MEKRIRLMDVPDELVKTIRSAHAKVDKKKLKIGLMKMGGLGDAMTLKVMAKKVREKYPDAFITVITRGFGEIFHDGRESNHVIDCPGYEWRLVYNKVKDEFDIFYDVGYAIRTVYNTLNEHRVWDQIKSLNSFLEYLPLWKDFPFSNKHLENLGMDIFQIMAKSSGLNVSQNDLYINVDETVKTPEMPYVTVHEGVGGRAYVKRARKGVFERLARYLEENGYRPVQIGYKLDDIIPYTDDYRGLTVSQSAGVIKKAKFHVDVESGTVYLAKAVGTPAVVLFGATPISCFGFDGNVNLSRNKCRACWWWNDSYNENWYEKCRKHRKVCSNQPKWDQVKNAVDEMIAKVK